jgi:O-antigen/teichoic acid export membrane protein
MTESAPSYGARAGRGVVVSLGNQLYRIVLQVLSVSLLARLLVPEDFGLVAMVLAVIGVGELFRDLGLSGAAVQARELTTDQRDNLFWLNAGTGAVVGLVVAACAPLIALAYDQPELVAITLALAPTFLLSGLTTQHRVGLVRALRFTRLAWIDASGTTLALGVGLVLAVTGAGYWALVGQQLAAGLLALALVVMADRWRPGRWHRGVGTRHFVSFGGHLLVSSLASYVSTNVDSFVVGRRFGPEVLGFYNRGAQLVRQPGRQVMTSFTLVLQPILARFHEDRERLVSALRHGLIAGAYPIAVVGAVIAADARGVVLLTLGPRWTQVTPYLVVMVLGVLLRQVTEGVSLALVACGKGRELSTYSVLSAVVFVGLVVAGATVGPVGAAVAYSLAPVLTWTAGYAWLRRHTGVPVGGLRLDGLRVVGLALLAAGVGRLVAGGLGDLHELARLPLVAVAVVAVFAAATTLPVVRRDVGVLLDYVRRLGQRESA